MGNSMIRYLLTLVIMINILFGDTVQRNRTALREGPGAWYPLIVEIGQGTQVKVNQDEGNWVEVEVDAYKGYISSKALKIKTQSKDVFSQMATMSPSPKVTQAGVSAAVKGFADRFSKTLGGDIESLEYIENYSTNFQSYMSFKQNTVSPKQIKKLKSKISLPRVKIDRPFSFSEEGSGLAVAAKLTSLGLLKDPKLEAYVNYVGTYVAEQSSGYDIPFRFFILDQSGINGYACPGGIIFITKGALDLMQSEAELACFLGHEIAHVIYHHGMKEMEERKEMIVAGNSFDDMSNTIGESDEVKALSAEMDNIALDSYENIFHGRLGQYENEADKIGVLYAARSGYDAHALLDFLKRVGEEESVNGNEHYSKSQNELRIKRINAYLVKQHWSKYDLKRKADRFVKNK